MIRLQQEALSSHTSFRIGGPAQYYFIPETREEVAEASNNASSRFWSIIDDSNLTGSEPNFKVSYVVDYHVLPKSILHNDLLPMNTLIEQLDQNLWR